MASLPWLWSLDLGSPVTVLSAAREAELLLALLADSTLVLLNTRGEIQARTRLPGPSVAAISDNGSAVVAGGAGGRIWWLAPDLSLKREESVGAPVTAVAVDPFGQYLAVSDRRGRIHLRDCLGTERGQMECPRPARHLAFVPEAPLLIAAADFGWVAVIDLTRADWAWSDRPVSNVGSLAVVGSGELIVLACFSDGLRRYGRLGQPRTSRPMPSPCGLVALNFAGNHGVAASTDARFFSFGATSELVFTEVLDETPTTLALSAIGDRLFLGTTSGTVRAAQLPE